MTQYPTPATNGSGRNSRAISPTAVLRASSSMASDRPSPSRWRPHCRSMNAVPSTSEKTGGTEVPRRDPGVRSGSFHAREIPVLPTAKPEYTVRQGRVWIRESRHSVVHGPQHPPVNRVVATARHFVDSASMSHKVAGSLVPGTAQYRRPVVVPTRKTRPMTGADGAHDGLR
jgi:hypothetical protein